MPLAAFLNTTHPDFEFSKIFLQNSIVSIPFLTRLPVSIPIFAGTARDFDPDGTGIEIGFGKKLGIGQSRRILLEDTISS